MASRFEARLVDITTLAVDAIVNAANPQLSPGQGVCGAIHRAAGPALAAACVQLPPCPPGQACITPGFDLPARFVIHAVGAIWYGGDRGEAAILESAYRSSFALARREKLRSLAFPALSTGIYGYPVAAATRIAVATIISEMALPGSPEHVIVACFEAHVLQAYRAEGV
jgi:O-acetyl-ADP-ribose deacetylase (regulator of RNase III)